MDSGAELRFLFGPATVTVRITGNGQVGNTDVYGTEMTQLDILGGDLPEGVMIRESPILASTGRDRDITPVSGGYMMERPLRCLSPN